MSKEEITLELVKLSYSDVIKANGHADNFDPKSIVTDLSNYIFSNIKVSEESK